MSSYEIAPFTDFGPLLAKSSAAIPFHDFFISPADVLSHLWIVNGQDRKKEAESAVVEASLIANCMSSILGAAHKGFAMRSDQVPLMPEQIRRSHGADWHSHC